MPLKSIGCKANVWKVYKCTPNFQVVKISTYKKAPPTAKKEWQVDFQKIVFLYNNNTRVKRGDIIDIQEFEIENGYQKPKGAYEYWKVTKWELHGKYDYSNIKVEYKGADYDDNED